MKNDIQALKDRLQIVLQRIDKIHGHKTYSDQVAKSFHLGMVGGSGHNVHALNERRARDLDKTVQNAVIVCALYKERDELQTKIQFEESGGRQRLEERRAKESQLLAEYWKRLKVGDSIDIGGNSKATITKKNAKSIETGPDCKWTVNEIIGNEAAKLITL